MGIDFAYCAAFLGGILVVQNRRIFPAADFIDQYAPILWVVFCGLLAVSYPIVLAKVRGQHIPLLATAVRLVLVLLISVAINFGIYRWQHSSEFFETSLQGAL